MRITRLVAGAVTAGLVGVTPIAISAPAHADGQTQTPVITAKLNISSSPYDPPYMYGGGFYVSGSVTDAAGLYDNANFAADTAYLQVYTASNPVWTTVATDDSPSYLFFDGGFTFTENAQFKVVYSGSPAAGSFDDTFLPGESAIISAPVTRKVAFSNPKGTLIKGKYRFTLPAPRRGKTQWRITVPGNAQFTKWETKGYTYSTRTQIAPKVAFTR